ncbi:LOW QUALITY PROTEIN: hypothetical protein NC652_032247 [Populus alba x Populus x berolinensis]|nr:LOW QUALITY PROTEIN: hypothetical protein NC652_032247 [Populus alba x Populus x berolinensis]
MTYKSSNISPPKYSGFLALESGAASQALLRRSQQLDGPLKYLELASQELRSWIPNLLLCGLNLFPDRVCGNPHGIIRKYGLMCCRQCFRSNAKEIGFIKSYDCCMNSFRNAFNFGLSSVLTLADPGDLPMWFLV